MRIIIIIIKQPAASDTYKAKSGADPFVTFLATQAAWVSSPLGSVRKGPSVGAT